LLQHLLSAWSSARSLRETLLQRFHSIIIGHRRQPRLGMVLYRNAFAECVALAGRASTDPLELGSVSVASAFCERGAALRTTTCRKGGNIIDHSDD
jgi:hypothetical protein